MLFFFLLINICAVTSHTWTYEHANREIRYILAHAIKTSIRRRFLEGGELLYQLDAVFWRGLLGKLEGKNSKNIGNIAVILTY